MARFRNFKTKAMVDVDDRNVTAIAYDCVTKHGKRRTTYALKASQVTCAHPQEVRCEDAEHDAHPVVALTAWCSKDVYDRHPYEKTVIHKDKTADGAAAAATT